MPFSWRVSWSPRRKKEKNKILNPEFFFYILLKKHRIRFTKSNENIKNLLCNQEFTIHREIEATRKTETIIPSRSRWVSILRESGAPSPKNWVFEQLNLGLNYLENYFIEELEDLTAILLSLHLLFCKVPAVFNIFCCQYIILFPNWISYHSFLFISSLRPGILGIHSRSPIFENKKKIFKNGKKNLRIVLILWFLGSLKVGQNVMIFGFLCSFAAFLSHVKEMSFFSSSLNSTKNRNWVWIDRRVDGLQLPSEMVHRTAFEISDLKNDIHQLC